MNFRYKLQQFLYGRYIFYGIDLLTKILAITCITLSVINLFLASFIVYIIETVLFILMFLRLFSKNIPARQQENQKDLNLFNKFKNLFTLSRRRYNDRQTHIYKKCPHCAVMLRLPKRKGEHTVNCPRCKNNFKVKVR
ncbi:MAG: hypothetical protein IIX54_03485 [Clostridia bacterium]|nr:hypothetical protein [Clostridia bacterium]